MTDTMHVSWTLFGNDVIFPGSRGPWFSCNYARVLKSKYPEQDEKILLQCIEALRFSEYCGNYWNSTVKSIHFVVVFKMWNCVALYKSLRYQWFLTFEYYWKQLQLHVWRYVCVTGVFIRVALYLIITHSTCGISCPQNRNPISSFSGTDRSTNSIALKCWFLWNNWLLQSSKKRTILLSKT